MKKISKESGDIRFGAFSSTDGITINPVKEFGPLSFLSFMAVKATLHPDGKIDCKRVRYHSQSTQNDMMLVHEAERVKAITRILSFSLFLAYLILCFVSYSRVAEVTLAFFFLSYAMQFIAYPIVLFFKRILGNENAKSLARFHSAEHAVINAYYDLNRVPTIDEIHEYSSYSYRCGSLVNFKQGILFLGFALARFAVSGLWIIPAMLAVCLICFILVKTNGITFMEFLVLDKPTDTEYTVAIKAMDESVKNIDVEDIVPDIGSLLSFIMMIEGTMEDNDLFDDERCKDCPDYEKCKNQFQDN